MDPLNQLNPLNSLAGSANSFGMGQDLSGLGGAFARLQGYGAQGPMNAQMLAMQQQMTNTLLYLTGLLMGLMLGRMAQGQMPGLQGLQGLQGLAGGPGGLGNRAAGGPGSLGGGTGANSPGGNTGGVGGNGVNGPNVPLGPATGKVGQFIDVAKAQQGDPYVFGATGPNAFDCSGLVYYSLRQAGVNVPRLTAAGYQKMFANSAVSRDQLKPGDLIFYWYPNSRGIPRGQASHIEIYLGNGMSMGTDNPSEGARIEPVNWSSFIGGARVPQLYS